MRANGASAEDCTKRVIDFTMAHRNHRIETEANDASSWMKGAFAKKKPEPREYDLGKK